MYYLVLLCFCFDESFKCFIPLIEGGILSTLCSAENQSNSELKLLDLQNKYFRGLNIVGWAIKSKNVNALSYIYKNGLRTCDPVDQHGNNSLHSVLSHGSKDQLNVVLKSGPIIFEERNKSNQTAAMAGVRSGNIKNVIVLLKAGANARTALSEKYAAWVLVFARRKEIFEKNTQTGRYGDDEMRWHPMFPDPDYLFWSDDK